MRSPLGLLAAASFALGALAGCGADEEDTPGHPGIAREAEHDLRATGHAVCASGPVLQGVDTSHYSGTVDWAKVAGSGRKFAFAKATEGLTYADPEFAAAWPAMKRAGLIRGAYHFFRRNDDGVAQARWFLAHVALAPGDLPPVLDWEWETTAAVPVALDVQRAQDFVAEIFQATGRRTILYSSANFLATVNSPTQFSGLPLWDANYTTGCPSIPDAWAQWTFWQYSGSGTVAGVSGSVDLNEFNGTLAQLEALAAVPAPDGGVTDAGVTDAGVTDAGVTDAGVTDAGVNDAGVNDAGVSGAAPIGGGCATLPGTTSAALPLALVWLALALRRSWRRGTLRLASASSTQPTQAQSSIRSS